MGSIRLKLRVRRPIRCAAWSDAPVAHDTQVTVYLNVSGSTAEKLARRTYAALEQAFARFDAYRSPAPCSRECDPEPTRSARLIIF
jgi:hypothetical protein